MDELTSLKVAGTHGVVSGGHVWEDDLQVPGVHGVLMTGLPQGVPNRSRQDNERKVAIGWIQKASKFGIFPTELRIRVRGHQEKTLLWN